MDFMTGSFRIAARHSLTWLIFFWHTKMIPQVTELFFFKYTTSIKFGKILLTIDHDDSGILSHFRASNYFNAYFN